MRGSDSYGFFPWAGFHLSLARCSSEYVQLKICSSMNSPLTIARNDVPDRNRYAPVVIGRKSVSPCSKLSSISYATEFMLSFCSHLSSCSNSSLALSRHAPK